MRKIFKILGIFIVVLLLVLIATPFLFRGKLEKLLKETLNKNLDATVAWNSVNLSLIKSFPDAALTLSEFSIANKGVFEGDTLIYGDRLELDMGLKQLFKKADKDPIQINTLILDGAIVNIKILEDGTANYNITKETDTAADKQDQTENTPFNLGLQHYELNDAIINYDDASTQTKLSLTHLNHEGNGDFSVAQSTLSTKTHSQVSLIYDNINYLDNNTIDLIADIGLDVENQKYTFKENKAILNALPLVFDGFIQLLDDGNMIDLHFETEQSDFKNFLAVIPETYERNLDEVKTAGDFSVNGNIKGIANDTYIPTLNIAVKSNNASFNYPSLPKQVDEITLDMLLKNETGITKDTYLNIDKLHFKIDEDEFAANGTLKNLTTNMLVNLAMTGRLDLSKIDEVYPVEFKDPLSGILDLDIETRFDMDAIDNHLYDRIYKTGDLKITDLNYTSDKLPKPLQVHQADINLNSERIKLERFSGETGATDINATGVIENLIPYVMSKEDLKGNFKITSKVFDLHDFTIPEEEEASSKTTKDSGRPTLQAVDTGVRIPDFLDASLDFSAQKVIYDNIDLANVSGSLVVKDEEAQLRNIVSDIFNGKAGVNGSVNTKDRVPLFDINLDLANIDIQESFEKLELLKSLAPIANVIKGALTTTLNLQGSMDKNLNPVLNTVGGDAFAKLISAAIEAKESPLISAFDSQLNFVDLSKINLSNLTTKMRFENGQVAIDPIGFKIEGIDAIVSGGHGFDNSLNYNLQLNIPAEALGGDVSKLLAKLNPQEKENLMVHLPVSLTGVFKQPRVNANVTGAVQDLTNQIIDIQKQRAIDVVNDKVDDVLSNILGGDTTSGDTTNTDDPKTEDAVKDVAGDLLNGLFGKKKKKKKDN